MRGADRPRLKGVFTMKRKLFILAGCENTANENPAGNNNGTGGFLNVYKEVFSL
jgi:hypothetical protein